MSNLEYLSKITKTLQNVFSSASANLKYYQNFQIEKKGKTTHPTDQSLNEPINLVRSNCKATRWCIICIQEASQLTVRILLCSAIQECTRLTIHKATFGATIVLFLNPKASTVLPVGRQKLEMCRQYRYWQYRPFCMGIGWSHETGIDIVIGLFHK